jgi:hypothetical protein
VFAVTTSVALSARCRIGPTTPALPDHLGTGHEGPLLLLAQLSVAVTCPRAAALPTASVVPATRHDAAFAAATASAPCVATRCSVYSTPVEHAV